MKKNKRKNKKHAYWYKANVKRFKIIFLFTNFAIFCGLFLVFSIILRVFINERFTFSIENQIQYFRNDIELNANDSSKYIGFTNIDDPRITAVYYYTDPKFVSQEQFLSPEITGSIVKGSLGREDVTPISEIKKQPTGIYAREKILGYNFETYILNIRYKAVESPNIKRDKIVCYVKIYMNIDGELGAKRDLNMILNILSLIVVLASYFASLIIMGYSVKPLEKMVEKQVTFVSDASHELRTPIAVVTSQIENMLTHPNDTVMDISEDLAICLTELKRLKKLVADLLNLARSDQDRISYKFDKYNVNQVLKEVIDPFAELAELNERKFTYSGVDIECFVDKDKVKELAIILLDNAVKYSNVGDSITATLTQDAKGNAIFEVADTGIGISEETKEKIFDRFYREDKARSRESGGNGLGLSIAKTICVDMHGKIFVDHNYPKGTKFTVVLPKIKKDKKETE